MSPHGASQLTFRQLPTLDCYREALSIAAAIAVQTICHVLPVIVPRHAFLYTAESSPSVPPCSPTPQKLVSMRAQTARLKLALTRPLNQD